MNPSKSQPALLGGVAMGVLSALPIVNLGNCACCAWLIVGGVLAAYLMQQNHPEPVQVGDGAIVGLMAGVVGAIVVTVVSIPLSMMMGGLQGGFLEQAMANAGDMPPEVREMLEGMAATGAVGIMATVVSFFMWLVLGTLFGMIGGILGAMIFRKNAPPPPPPPPAGFTPGTFGSHGTHGEAHGGHTFKPPTFNPPPPPASGQ